MRAALLREYHRPLELVERPVPEPAHPNDVLVRVGGAGVCATDLHAMDGLMEPAGVSLPRVLGHENAGWVEEVGSGVKVASEAVLAVAFDPSGTMLVTAGDDSSVRLIDVATRTEIGQAFPGIAGPPAFAAFTPDGSHIIAGNVANHLYEWDVDPTDWAAHACEVAGRNFTPAEWNAYLPGRPYQAVCPAAVN